MIASATTWTEESSCSDVRWYYALTVFSAGGNRFLFPPTSFPNTAACERREAVRQTWRADQVLVAFSCPTGVG